MNRRCPLFLLTAWLAAVANTSTALGQSVTQSVEYPPVAMDYTDLLRIVQRARGFVAQSTPDSTLVYSDELSVSDGVRRVSASGSAIDSLRVLAPKKATQVDYRLSQRPAPIDAVTIDLGDWSRVVRISGSSPEQVEALSALLREDLGAHRALLAGPKLRLLAGVLLLVGSVVWFYLPGARPKWTQLGVFVLAQVAIYLPPWEQWLAGTAVYTESASFAVRHSGSISLAGLVLAVASVVQGFRGSTRRTTSPASGVDAA